MQCMMKYVMKSTLYYFDVFVTASFIRWQHSFLFKIFLNCLNGLSVRYASNELTDSRLTVEWME